jgi:hypothetical protein
MFVILPTHVGYVCRLHGIRAIKVIRSAGDVEGSGGAWSHEFSGAPGPIVERLRTHLQIVQLHHAVHI